MVYVLKMDLRNLFKSFVYFKKIFINLFLHKFIKFFRFPGVLLCPLGREGLISGCIVGGLMEGVG